MDEILKWLDDINETVKDVERKTDNVVGNTSQLESKMDTIIEILKEINEKID
ncbi:hypothetical protein [Tissierella praeacuta]|uniref:hypothetical protein n=1 Tax=Tissierella praeacuta TaxID=43131 RepID=UPI0028AAF575|nr:hypothetical protein [Tissierella praeacuta]